MSEPNPQPPTTPPPVETAASPEPAPAVAPAVAPPAPRSRRLPWVLVVVVAVVSLLAGVGGTTAAFLLYDRVDVPDYTFHVTVFLKPGATAAEREQVRSVLDGIDTAGKVQYESREQAYENFKELYEDSPDLVESVRPDTLPDSFRFETKGTDFDCGILEPLHDLPAVDEAHVSGVPDDRGSPPKLVSCP